MIFKYNNIAIIGDYYKKEVINIIEFLYVLLRRQESLRIIVEENTAINTSLININKRSLKDIALTCDVAILVGGDGNFLKISRILSIYSSIPVIGINKGKLGFLTTLTVNNNIFKNNLYSILTGSNLITKIIILKCNIDNNSNISLAASTAVNEIAIMASKGVMFGIKVFIDNNYAFDQKGDGIIISTPTGSTAHAMSAGGPILSPDQNSILLVPICSHSLNSRPIVISDKSIIDICITNYNNSNPILSIDGRHNSILKPYQRVTIKKSRRKVTILHTKNYNYYSTLREKLGWNKMLF